MARQFSPLFYGLGIRTALFRFEFPVGLVVFAISGFVVLHVPTLLPEDDLDIHHVVCPQIFAGIVDVVLAGDAQAVGVLQNFVHQRVLHDATITIRIQILLQMRVDCFDHELGDVGTGDGVSLLQCFLWG